jgi:WD40 repeat protein
VSTLWGWEVYRRERSLGHGSGKGEQGPNQHGQMDARLRPGSLLPVFRTSSGLSFHRSTFLFLMAPSRGPEPLPRALHIALENHKGPVHVARYAKGSAKYVLTGGQDRVVRLWNPALGTEIKSYSAHGYEVLSISV